MKDKWLYKNSKIFKCTDCKKEFDRNIESIGRWVSILSRDYKGKTRWRYEPQCRKCSKEDIKEHLKSLNII
tara:strand:- start:795 stop:1007 length:213 start_codon:yes stop_codon:yes gene_type:complete